MKFKSQADPKYVVHGSDISSQLADDWYLDAWNSATASTYSGYVQTVYSASLRRRNTNERLDIETPYPYHLLSELNLTQQTLDSDRRDAIKQVNLALGIHADADATPRPTPPPLDPDFIDPPLQFRKPPFAGRLSSHSRELDKWRMAYLVIAMLGWAVVVVAVMLSTWQVLN